MVTIGLLLPLHPRGDLGPSSCSPSPPPVSTARQGRLAPVPWTSSHKGGWVSRGLYHRDTITHSEIKAQLFLSRRQLVFTRLYHIPSTIRPPRYPHRAFWRSSRKDRGNTQSVGQDRRSTARPPPTCPFRRGWVPEPLCRWFLVIFGLSKILGGCREASLRLIPY